MERRTVRLAEDVAREGLERYRALELASEAWQDWLAAQYGACGLDPERDEISINPLTGRISALVRAGARHGGETDSGAGGPAGEPLPGEGGG